MDKIWISIGNSRLEKNWKNKELHWEELIDRLRRPKVTNETLKEYLAMKSDEQGAIKDVGGFVGGIIVGGRRKIGCISARYLITLDIDYGTKFFWDEFCLQFDFAACIYSTHKHSDADPRYRLVIPLSTPLMSDQYEAVSRKLASLMNIELFDDTTYQAERLMYWPSVSKDVNYYFKVQNGEWLDPLTILDSYADWTDTTQWPFSKRSKNKVRSAVDKQEDPTEKGGQIGVFCRAYTITEAIDKYLPDVYQITDHDDRYTYVHGSTSGGMIVYNDMFSFSHHSTDPTSSRLCNSFDLVRIHLYSKFDDNLKEGTPQSKVPSVLKMLELMQNDPIVKTLVISEKLEEKHKAAAGSKVAVLLRDAENQAEDKSEDKDWMSKCDVDKKGVLLNTINNCVLALQNDKALKGNLCWNDFQKSTHIKWDLPWRKVTSMSCEWSDADDAELRNYLEVFYGLTNRNNIADALTVVMQQNSFHPVKTYLSGITWDGKNRLDRLLIEHLGAEDSEYVRVVTRKTFVAAVARIYQPGIKFDTVLTLVGPQGLGKSRLIKKMFKDWYSDTFGNLQSKDAMENIQGVWGMEIGELAGLKKHEVDLIKLFISAPVDRFRVAYGRRVGSYPRQCVFIGSTNEKVFLVDQTGNRRWWPVMLGLNSENVKTLDSGDRDQIWAEACYWYAQGEELYLNKNDEQEAKEVQETYTEQDDRRDGLIKYLDTLVPVTWQDMNLFDRIAFLNGDEEFKAEATHLREWITLPEIWLEHLRGTSRDLTPYNTKFIRNIMNKLPNWESKMLNKKPYGHQRGWARMDDIYTRAVARIVAGN